MNKTNRLLWSFIALAWAAWVVSFLFLHITRDPGHRIITVIGDAPKNYYTYLYHILYEKGFWFGGMNYPYGELLVYTDAQPLLSVPLAWLNHIGVPVTRETALAVMHLCMAGSFVLGIFFTYRSLLFFGLRHWAALAFATVIILLSPQVFRILGHFALSYASFLPMLFYFSMRYHYSSRVKYAIYILLLSITMYFIHPYYVAMSLIWCGCYFLGYLLLTRNTGRRQKFRHLAPFLGATLGILVFVSSFMALADHATDRPTYPYGTTTYVTRFKDIFTSWHSPLWQRMQEKGWVEATGNNQDEGYAYMGLAVMLILSVALILALVRLFRKKKTDTINSPATPATGIWLFIALAALTLSMGVPFIWNMEWLLDYMSLFRQFRTLGRFSWIFQYTISIYAVVTLYRWYSSLLARNRKVPAWLVLLFPLLLWAYEALPYVKVIRHISHHSGNLYKEYFLTEGENWEQFLGQHHYKKDDFQGLLLLPFIHVGSEKLAVGAQGGWLLYMSCKASVTLQLPIVDVMMSRSSWSQAEGQVRIAGGPFADKPLLRDIKSDKPFLLMQFEVDPITPDEAYLLSCSDHIGHFSQCHVYSCYPERIRKQDQFLRQSALSQLPQQQTDTCSNCKDTWYVNHFDDHPQELRLAGAGALPPIKTADSMLAEVAIKPLSDSVEYEWSTWVLMGKDYRTPYFTVTMLDSAGKELSHKDVSTKESVDNKGLWFRTAVFFKVPAACRKLQWWVHNDTQKTAYLALDELLLRPVHATVCSRRDDSTILVNNHLIR